jgi:hypothetical protein
LSPEGVLTSPNSATALAQSPWRVPPYRSLENQLNKKNGKMKFLEATIRIHEIVNKPSGLKHFK